MFLLRCRSKLGEGGETAERGQILEFGRVHPNLKHPPFAVLLKFQWVVEARISPGQFGGHFLDLLVRWQLGGTSEPVGIERREAVQSGDVLGQPEDANRPIPVRREQSLAVGGERHPLCGRQTGPLPEGDKAIPNPQIHCSAVPSGRREEAHLGRGIFRGIVIRWQRKLVDTVRPGSTAVAPSPPVR